MTFNELENWVDKNYSGYSLSNVKSTLSQVKGFLDTDVLDDLSQIDLSKIGHAMVEANRSPHHIIRFERALEYFQKNETPSTRLRGNSYISSGEKRRRRRSTRDYLLVLPDSFDTIRIQGLPRILTEEESYYLINAIRKLGGLCED